MRAIGLILLGGALFTAIYSCGSGGKRPDYDDFPTRSKEFSVWTKCTDGSYDKVCKLVCEDYTRKNRCKDGKMREVSLDIKEAIDDGYVIMSKAMFIKLLTEK